MANIKGVVLAGGTGSRLLPLTKVTNKALLPVYDRPMIYWPIQTLVNAGIKDVMVICGGNSIGDIFRGLGNGEDFGLRTLYFAQQKEAGGIAQALSLAEEWVARSPIAVVLGDNYFQDDITPYVKEFNEDSHGARIFVKEVEKPDRYGVVELDKENKVISIEEKPKNPKSNWVQSGLYFYDSQVWHCIKKLKPSNRGELEITDVNNFYLNQNSLIAHPLQNWWGDCGESIDVYHDASVKIAEIERAKKNFTK